MYVDKFTLRGQVYFLWTSAFYRDKLTLYVDTCTLYGSIFYVNKCAPWGQVYAMWTRVLYMDKCTLYGQVYSKWANASKACHKSIRTSVFYSDSITSEQIKAISAILDFSVSVFKFKITFEDLHKFCNFVPGSTYNQ